MKLYVPRLGDRIQLTKDWEFEFESESRNSTLIQHMTGNYLVDWSNLPKKDRYTIPAGSILKVDRIYIRQGQKAFDSMTFYWEGVKTRGGKYPCSWNPSRMETISSKTVRFWVKLGEANNIEFDNV